MTGRRINPYEPRRLGAREPPVVRQHVDVFVASHLIAFGTDYTANHYYREAACALEEGDALNWVIDTPYYRALLEESLEKGDVSNAVRIYLDARGHSRAMSDAAHVLIEGARRGEVRVLAKPVGGAGDYENLQPTDFIDRGSLSYTSGKLNRYAGAPGEYTADWECLLFVREDVLAVRAATWHSVGRPPAPLPHDTPARAEQMTLTEFVTSPEVLQRAFRAIFESHATLTKGELARRLCEMFKAQTGAGTNEKSVEAIWRKPHIQLSLAELQERAQQGAN